MPLKDKQVCCFDKLQKSAPLCYTEIEIYFNVVNNLVQYATKVLNVLTICLITSISSLLLKDRTL